MAYLRTRHVKRDGRGKLTQYLATEPTKAYIRTRTFRSAQMSKSHTPEVLEKVSIRNTFPPIRIASKSLPSPPPKRPLFCWARSVSGAFRSFACVIERGQTPWTLGLVVEGPGWRRGIWGFSRPGSASGFAGGELSLLSEWRRSGTFRKEVPLEQGPLLRARVYDRQSISGPAGPTSRRPTWMTICKGIGYGASALRPCSSSGQRKMRRSLRRAGASQRYWSSRCSFTTLFGTLVRTRQ